MDVFSIGKGCKKEIMEIVNLSIGLPKKMEYGNNQQMETGICKDTVDEAFLTSNGFIGDGVADLKHHGGLDRAVCIYPYEHYLLWEKEFGEPLPKCSFGENLTVTNMLEEDVNIGDIFQIGEAVIQITQGRIPCNTINRRTNIPHIMKRIVATGYTGYLCRVLVEGTIRKDSSIQLIKKHPKNISVLYANEIQFRLQKDHAAIHSLLEIDELANEWKETMQKRLSKITN